MVLKVGMHLTYIGIQLRVSCGFLVRKIGKVKLAVRLAVEESAPSLRFFSHQIWSSFPPDLDSALFFDALETTDIPQKLGKYLECQNAFPEKWWLINKNKYSTRQTYTV